MLKTPAPEEVISRSSTPVSTLVTLILAPATIPPFSSVTVPVMAPVEPPCAKRDTGINSESNKQATTNLFMKCISPPGGHPTPTEVRGRVLTEACRNRLITEVLGTAKSKQATVVGPLFAIELPERIYILGTILSVVCGRCPWRRLVTTQFLVENYGFL